MIIASQATDIAQDLDETALRGDEPGPERVLTISMLIFSLGFCALVFWAGSKEVAAYEKCGLRGAITVGHSCQESASALPHKHRY
jgi:hypothetical protein